MFKLIVADPKVDTTLSIVLGGTGKFPVIAH